MYKMEPSEVSTSSDLSAILFVNCTAPFDVMIAFVARTLPNRLTQEGTSHKMGKIRKYIQIAPKKANDYRESSRKLRRAVDSSVADRRRASSLILAIPSMLFTMNDSRSSIVAF